MLCFNVCLNMPNIQLFSNNYSKMWPLLGTLSPSTLEVSLAAGILYIKSHFQRASSGARTSNILESFSVFFRSKSWYNLLYIKHLNTLHSVYIYSCIFNDSAESSSCNVRMCVVCALCVSVSSPYHAIYFEGLLPSTNLQIL